MTTAILVLRRLVISPAILAAARRGPRRRGRVSEPRSAAHRVYGKVSRQGTVTHGAGHLKSLSPAFGTASYIASMLRPTIILDLEARGFRQHSSRRGRLLPRFRHPGSRSVNDSVTLWGDGRHLDVVNPFHRVCAGRTPGCEPGKRPRQAKNNKGIRTCIDTRQRRRPPSPRFC